MPYLTRDSHHYLHPRKPRWSKRDEWWEDNTGVALCEALCIEEGLPWLLKLLPKVERGQCMRLSGKLTGEVIEEHGD